MTRLIDIGLEEQSVLLTRMGELTYQTLSIAIKAYIDGSTAQGQVQELSDRLMLMSNKVEDRTFELIARFQPVASDLRTIKSYMKIGYDFTRYGRYALDISYINDQINGLSECNPHIITHIKEMSEKVLQMVKISIDALRKHDITLARTIPEIEHKIDQMYQSHLKNLIAEEQTSNKCVISTTLMVRYLERIADHAVYVCESILYIVTGEKTYLR